MKKLVLIFTVLLTIQFGYSQVGINTTNPNAQLDIKSSNQATPANNDGILIPKIDAFPLTNPTAAQNSMMVYLTTTSAGKQPGFYYWDNATTSWKGFAGNSGWELTGNSGTNPTNNFIGTTDDNDVIFKRNNTKAGQIGVDNTAFGTSSLGSLSTGYANTAIGKQAMAAGTTGWENTAIGAEALASGTWGYQNTAIGFRALTSSTTSPNTAIGAMSLAGNISGQSNTAVGNSSLPVNTNGYDNTAVGAGALATNLNGSGNTAIGMTAASNLTTGDRNISIGANAQLPSSTLSNQMSIGNVIYGSDMYSTATGKIGIGIPVPAVKLDIEETSTTKQSVLNVKHTNPSNIGSTYAIKTSLTTSQPAGILVGTQNYITVANAAKGFGTDNVIAGSSSDEVGCTSNTMIANGSGIKSGTSNFISGSSTGIVNGVQNLMNSVTSSEQNGIRSQFNSANSTTENGILNLLSGSGDGEKSGLRNSITNTGSGIHYGTYSYFTGVASGTQYGSWNRIDVTGTGDKYCSFNLIPTTAGGQHYGVYSNVLNATGYSGYFLGRFSIGTTTANNYILPASRGTANQIMQTDATGNVTWQNPNSALNNFAWTTTGNSGTNPTTNFIGTTDNNDVVFKRNNAKAGLIGGYIAGYGLFSLNANTTGSANAAFGAYSLASNTTGSSNVAVGTDAMSRIQQGSQGTTIGSAAMFYFSGPSGPFTNTNVAIGASAMSGEHFGSLPGSNNIGLNNTAIGYRVLNNISSGSDNTVQGYNGMYSNTTGNKNTAFGSESLYTNISGIANVAIGYQAAYNETGSNKLYIENSASSTPLIYGEFDTDLIRINGKTEGIYTQLTANGDGQSSIYGYRTRDSQNDGTSYSRIGTNKATSGYNLWGDLYTFGVTGHSDNDFTRTGGVLGSVTGGTYWSSLGYKNSAGTAYGVYATAALTVGTGRMNEPQNAFSIGGGFYGDLIGSWSKGNLIGNINSGKLLASYNNGDEYTSGKQIELVTTGTSKTAAYTVTSTESVVYKKGKITLNNGTARVSFDENYKNLLGEVPVVTITPMGQCNGLYIESIDKDGFVIKELNNGSSTVSVSWIAVGNRIDATNTIPESVLDKNFDANINEVMFNENNKEQNAKAIWSDGRNIQFGVLPDNLIEKPIKNEK